MFISVRIFFQQLLRSKKRLILNVVLLTAATAFFIMSLNLYQNSTANLQRVEETYSTMATVTFFGDMNSKGELTDPEAEDHLGYGIMLPKDYDLTPLLAPDCVKGYSRNIRCEAYIPGTPAISTILSENISEAEIKVYKRDPNAIYLNSDQLMFRFTIDGDEPVRAPVRWDGALYEAAVDLNVNITASTLGNLAPRQRIRLAIYGMEAEDIRRLNGNDDIDYLTFYPGVEYLYAGGHYVYFSKDPESGKLIYEVCYMSYGGMENGGQFTVYERAPDYLRNYDVAYFEAGSPYYDAEWKDDSLPFMLQRWEDLQSDAATAEYFDTLWKATEYHNYGFSVTLTENIATLPAWHLNGMYLNKGRLITPEEYESGAKVCMITGHMADRQGWKVGDKLDMHLFSNLEYVSGIGTEYLDYPGYNYTTKEFFDTGTYEIVGILGQREIVGTSDKTPDPFYQPWNTIYIPAASAPNAPAAELQPLQPSLFSIQLENGTIDEYLKAMDALGVTQKTEGEYMLEIHCYDQGYSIVQPGLVRMKSSAQLMLILSLVLLLTTLVLVAYFFAQHQKASAGILRMLGGTKQQAFAGILVCALLVVVIGAVLGGISGGYLSEEVGKQVLASDAARQEALKEFSTELVNSRNVISGGISAGADLLVTGLGALGIVCSFLLLLGLFVGNYLKIEPRELMTQRR